MAEDSTTITVENSLSIEVVSKETGGRIWNVDVKGLGTKKHISRGEVVEYGTQESGVFTFNITTDPDSEYKRYYDEEEDVDVVETDSLIVEMVEKGEGGTYRGVT